MNKEALHFLPNFTVAVASVVAVILSFKPIFFFAFYTWIFLYLTTCLFESAARSRARSSKQIYIALPVREVALSIIPSIFISIGMTFAGFFMSFGSILNTYTGKLADSWFEYVYYSFVTLTTLGYGDYIPADNITRIIVVFELATGITFLVLFVGLIISRISSLK